MNKADDRRRHHIVHRCIEEVLQAGVDVNKADDIGDTTLFMAALKRHKRQVQKCTAPS